MLGLDCIRRANGANTSCGVAAADGSRSKTPAIAGFRALTSDSIQHVSGFSGPYSSANARHCAAGAGPVSGSP